MLQQLHHTYPTYTIMVLKLVTSFFLYSDPKKTWVCVTYITALSRAFLFLYLLFVYAISLPLCCWGFFLVGFCFFFFFWDSAFGVLHLAFTSFGFKGLQYGSLYLSCLVFLTVNGEK